MRRNQLCNQFCTSRLAPREKEISGSMCRTASEIRDNLHFMLIAELKRGLSDVSRSVSCGMESKRVLCHCERPAHAPLTVLLWNVIDALVHAIRV